MNLLEMTRSEKREQDKPWTHKSGSESVTLGDGITVTIRPIHADDAPRLQALYDRLSPECIFSRFLGFCNALPFQQARRLANVDYQTQMALVATREKHGEEYIVAVASYWLIPADEPGLAEPAIVVEDRYQNRGLGTHLLKRLAAYARAHGVRTFLTTVHHSNARILHLIRRSGLPTEGKLEAGTWEIRVELEMGRGVTPGHKRYGGR